MIKMEKMRKQYLNGSSLEIHNANCPNCGIRYDMYEDIYLGHSKLQNGKKYAMAECRCGVVFGVPVEQD